MPVTDVLQMMGRAGRPQFDDSGVACIFVHEPKVGFIDKYILPYYIYYIHVYNISDEFVLINLFDFL